MDKNELTEDFIERINPYEEHHPIDFDLRGYAKYIEEHGLSGKDITPEIVNGFVESKND